MHDRKRICIRMYTHTHIYTHPLNPLCTRNRHSFTAIPESNLLHSVHSHLAIVSHRSTDNNEILVLSVVYLRVYLFVVILYSYFLRSVPPSIYSLQTTSIWSPCIVIRFPEVFTISNFTVYDHWPQKHKIYEKPILLETCVPFSFPCLSMVSRRIDRRRNI